MENNLDLKNIADSVKKEYRADSDENIQVVDQTESYDDGPVILFGDTNINSSKIELTEDEIDIENKPVSITENDLKSAMPDLDELTYNNTAPELKKSLEGYRKGLLINGGFTIEEVNLAVKNRLANKGKEINTKYLEENPKVGIIEINKTDEKNIQLTAEERAKLQKVKSIRLVAVEDMELATLKVDRIEKKSKTSFLKTIEGNLSKYSIPLPLIGDFVTFRGAQIIQLIGTVKYEDESFDELIKKKASLIYDRMIGGTITQKYEDGRIVMPYTEFANKFRFHDIDMALFGILVASSMEEVETQLTCSHCNTPFQWKYNLKTLLKLDGISDKFKALIDNILSSKNNGEYLEKVNKDMSKVMRLKSPITQNVYEVGYPSVSRAISIYEKIDQKDSTIVYLSTVALFLHSFYIYNTKNDSYVHIEDDEIEAMMEALQIIPQEDLDILFIQIKDMLYIPEFVLGSKCPSCGNSMTNTLSVDDLVFLRAQDSSTEIK
jgi:hypothetical protein